MKANFWTRYQTAVEVVLALAAVVLVNHLAFRHHRRFDWTRDHAFTLSARSQEVARTVGQPVQVYLLLSSSEPMYRDVRELLERLHAANPSKIIVRAIDPERETDAFRRTTERLQVSAAQVAVVMERGTGATHKVWTITEDDLVQNDFQAEAEVDSLRIDVRSEEALVGGLLEVVSERKTRVCMTEGHGEWTVNLSAERDLGPLVAEMRHDNLEVVQLSPRTDPNYLERCDAVFVIAPMQTWDAEDAVKLREYAMRGGNLLIALPPHIERAPSMDDAGVAIPDSNAHRYLPSGLESIARDLGIEPVDAWVMEMDPEASVPGGFVAVDFDGAHPTTRILGEVRAPVGMSEARPLRLLDANRTTALMRTTEHSFAIVGVERALAETAPTEAAEGDIRGPLTLAASIEVEPFGATPGRSGEDGGQSSTTHRGGRVVILGNADMFTPSLVASTSFANFPFANALFSWLTERDALIQIPPRRTQAIPMQITEGDAWSIGVRVALILPLAAVFMGVAMWLQRRK